MSDVDDDNNDDDDNDDDDTMQIDNESNIPNKEIIEGLNLLHLKSLYNFTESAYDDIMKALTTNNISLYKAKKYLKEITGFVPEFYDMCENSCICYTGQYESYQTCSTCNFTRSDTRGKAKKVMPYLSVKDRLKIQFNDENRAKELLYRYEYIINKDDDDLNDIFDGNIYKELLERNLFKDKRDVAFTVSCDGYQIFKQKTDDCWAFLIINNNLNPSIRVKKENLLIPFLIPGLKQPKDFNTFLQPFINEMKELEGKYFI
jgi:Transposase family tnp2